MKKRILSAEDKMAWEKVMEDVEFLPKSNLRLRGEKSLRTTPKIPIFDRDDLSSGFEKKLAPSSNFPSKTVKNDSQMDKKVFSRMKRGLLNPEATIDLHGYTLSQAYPILKRFILASFKSGCRLVLVITGKGGRKQLEPYQNENFADLKRQVPQWLKSAELQNKILEATHAHVKHGGSGALYVYLKRKKKN